MLPATRFRRPNVGNIAVPPSTYFKSEANLFAATKTAGLPTMMQRFLVFFALIAILAGCGSTPRQSEISESDDTTIALDDITEILAEADEIGGDDRVRIYLDVVTALIDAQETDWARNTLGQLNPNTVPDNQFVRFTVLSAGLAMAQGDPLRAKSWLWRERLMRIAPTAPDAERVHLLTMRAQILEALAEYRESIANRIELSQLLASEDGSYINNQSALWRSLMALPYTDLLMESQIQDDMLAQGWYTLAALSKNNQTNLKEQIRAVESWQLNWPEHPASLSLPADLQLLQKLAEDRPKRVAILLPLNGRFSSAASAIRDGIMAAYYDAQQNGESVPNLRFIDSSQGDINALYDDAALNGAELIIGPLEQQKITELALRPELPVPTLSLNRLPENSPPVQGLFQFGLPLEDEAAQVADQAWRDGHRRALILSPTGSNGDRSVHSFSERWLALGGEVVQDYRYRDQSEFGNLIKSAMKIDASEQRLKRMRQVLGRKLEFEPRRRKDIDFIFLYSQASQARQFKPLLAFHYAGDIPVYSIKDIFTGRSDARRDRDLNGIRFTTLPWMFSQDLPEKQAIEAAIPQSNLHFLYALGVDAYHLHPRLLQLATVPEAYFYGATGRLLIDDQNRVRREQIWAVFEGGTPRPVTTFASEDVL